MKRSVGLSLSLYEWKRVLASCLYLFDSLSPSLRILLLSARTDGLILSCLKKRRRSRVRFQRRREESFYIIFPLSYCVVVWRPSSLSLLDSSVLFAS